METFALRLRGLWIGLALGELYATGQLEQQVSTERTTPLPRTQRLYQNAERWMQASEAKIQIFLLEEMRSPNLLLDVIPLAFLHPLGTLGLQDNLKKCLAKTDDRKVVDNAMEVLQTLEVLMTPSDSLRQQPPSKSELTQQTLQTLDDFRLSVKRTNLIYTQPEITMLSASLSGFQNGLRGLPLFWRLKLRTLRWNSESSCEDDLCALADRCLAQWAGCYGSEQLNGGGGVAIAPLGQLRPR